jgi:photosystem II stability/assembly factor-like uncharacterized protein/type II secretory pathway pseudopilin PulG
MLFAIATVLMFLVSGNVSPAQKPKGGTTSAGQPDYEAILKQLHFREIGPASMGGRIDDFAVVEGNPDIIYVGAASGGVFKTTNGGTTWTPVFDNEATSTIGDITIAPSDPSIVWVGTGEANNRQSSSWGNGVYKSTDAGKTWQHMGLSETHHIARIVIHPTDPNTLYVAAVGRLWGPSKERGVYKTTDGGKTWSNVLFVNEDTGVTDIAMDHQSPGTLIAAAYQRRRTAFGFKGSGPGGGLYKTTDGGATWKKLEKGLPWDPTPRPTPPPAGGGFGGGGGGGGGAGAALRAQQAAEAAAAATPPDPAAMKETGRIGVSFYRKDTNIVYALIEHANGGTFRSEDKGETWTRMSDTNPRAMYYSQIHIDPNNDQRLWAHGANMYTSDDGGRTFRQNLVQRIHGDYHAMWIDPQDSNHMITGSDGGIYISRDRGRTWDFVNTIPLAQFYEVGLDMAKPYHICGGLQDNNVWCGPSATLDSRGISNADWFTVSGGDGFYAQIDPTDPNIVYAESQDGGVLRRDLRTHESRSIRPPAPEGERYRFQWNSPIVISAFDPKTIYYGGNFLFKSPDRGDSWTRLGSDLTSGQERDKLPIMGKVPDKYTLSRHDGVQAWPAITTISESPINKDLLWVGTDDGNLHVTRDGGKNWKNVFDKVKGVPKGTYVTRVAASRHAEGTAYATFDGHRSNDFGIYVYMTTDYGENWKAIRNGLPDDNGTVHVIREHHRNPKLLFAGTEHGLYFSIDQGGSWHRLKLNLPTVPVDDIAIHPRDNDLVLGTHGRSIWILDDITILEQMSEAVANEDLHLFDSRPATSWRIANRGGSTGHKIFLGPNPPNGALIQYYLKSKPDDKERVRVTITDKDGKAVREIPGTKEIGINRVVWDLRARTIVPPASEREGGEAAPGAAAGEAAEAGEQAAALGFGFGFGGGFGGGGASLRVEPGEYTAKVTVGKLEQSKKIVVEEDPRITISAEDRAARRQALTQVAQMVSTAIAGQRSMTGLHTTLNTYVESWKRPGAAKPPDNVRKAAEDLLKRVEETCRKFANPVQCGERGPGQGTAGPPLVYTPPAITQRLGQLLGGIESFTAAPTAWQLDQIKLLQGMLTEASTAAQKLSKDDLAALNKMMNDAGVPHIVIPGGGRQGAGAAPGDENEGDEDP